MIGSIALVCAAFTTASTAANGVGRGIDVAWHSVAPDLVARRDDHHDADDADDDDEEDENHDRPRDVERQRRDRDRELRDQHRRSLDDRRMRLGFRDHDDEDDEDDDGRAVTARASARDGHVALPVNGPVTLRLRVQSGEIEVMAADKPQVAATVSGTRLSGNLQLVQSGNRVELRVSGHQVNRGNVRVEVPRGTNLEFDSTSGDVTARGTGGDVRVRTMSGDVKVQGARRVDVETISGDVAVDGNARLRLHTVSGNVVANTTDPAPQLDFESASGGLDWTGVCAKGCHLAVETVSGDVKLNVDRKSSFELAYSSHSGELRDELKLQMKHAPKRKHGEPGGWAEAVYGNGEGLIECDAFSGDVQIRPR
jgi:DUF4097 and DUF4098 domain-containing protein YvlB